MVAEIAQDASVNEVVAKRLLPGLHLVGAAASAAVGFASRTGQTHVTQGHEHGGVAGDRAVDHLPEPLVVMSTQTHTSVAAPSMSPPP